MAILLNTHAVCTDMVVQTLSTVDVVAFWNSIISDSELKRHMKLSDNSMDNSTQILTHEKIQDCHVYKIHQSGAFVVRWCFFYFVTVRRVLLPTENKSNQLQANYL